MKNYVQPGETLTLTAPRALASGAGLLVGSIFAIATADAAQGANVEAITRGVFDLPKAAGAVTLQRHHDVGRQHPDRRGDPGRRRR